MSKISVGVQPTEIHQVDGCKWTESNDALDLSSQRVNWFSKSLFYLKISHKKRRMIGWDSYVKALKKDLASKAMKSKIIIDLSTINGSRAPKRPTIQEIENLVIGTLKLNPRSLQGIHTCPGARSILILILKNELNIEDTFIIRNGSTSDDGIKGTVRGLRAQRKDTDGNPIIYEKNVIVHSPHEDVKAKDIEEVLLNFGEITRPTKECNFLDEKKKRPALLGDFEVKMQ
ncbi:Hypothetical protein FKW44_000151 [Caligus rogercresseyi]|uniref:Uncharacterized protein n=1 Tax=Caligus rogercresseyi TaxID=217165 RepID=A0A7T8KH62_CALRO|nr:Hypothetical protein FKW44_000151 [Caligus rogercresseyi]